MSLNIFADKRNYLEINGWRLCVCVCVCVYVCVCMCVFVTSIHGLYCAYYAMTWNLVNINCLNCVSHPGVELCLIGYPWPVYPGSTGILPHSLPEWAFRARPGLWRI